jgi:hypothetical protein
MSIIDEALSANATIANGYDPGRGGPPAPKIAIVTCADPRLDRAGGPGPGVRFRRQHRAAQRGVPGRGDPRWLARAAPLRRVLREDA